MRSTQAVLLAGGQGQRLRPYTRVLPKPLIPLGDEPVMGVLIRQMRRSGLGRAYIMTGYLGYLIRALFGSGERYGLQICYREEKAPLGTMGPLSLLRDELDGTFLVANGDLVVDLDFQDLLDFHRASGAIATVACHPRTVSIDFGVVETNEHGAMTAFREKPSREVLVNMGIYVFEPAVLAYVPDTGHFGADALLHALLADNQTIQVYRHEGEWMDIGRVEDLMKAQEQADAQASSPLKADLSSSSSDPAASVHQLKLPASELESGEISLHALHGASTRDPQEAGAH